MTQPATGERRPIMAPVPVHDELARIRAAMIAEKGRDVTFGEVLEWLLATRPKLRGEQ